MKNAADLTAPRERILPPPQERKARDAARRTANMTIYSEPARRAKRRAQDAARRAEAAAAQHSTQQSRHYRMMAQDAAHDAATIRGQAAAAAALVYTLNSGMGEAAKYAERYTATLTRFAQAAQVAVKRAQVAEDAALANSPLMVATFKIDRMGDLLIWAGHVNANANPNEAAFVQDGQNVDEILADDTDLSAQEAADLRAGWIIDAAISEERYLCLMGIEY